MVNISAFLTFFLPVLHFFRKFGRKKTVGIWYLKLGFYIPESRTLAYLNITGLICRMCFGKHRQKTKKRGRLKPCKNCWWCSVCFAVLKTDLMAALNKEVKSLDEDSWMFDGPRSRINLISRPGKLFSYQLSLFVIRSCLFLFLLPWLSLIEIGT